MISVATGLALWKSGAVMLVGGGSTTQAMVDQFVKLCGRKDALIVVMPQTREEPSKGVSSGEMLTKSGLTNVIVIREDSFSSESLNRLELRLQEARGVWVPGGDQNLFLKRFGASWCQRVFPKLVANGLNWFGTSAGAMIASNPMIAGNKDGGAVMAEGIGLVDALVDSHYRVRRRENRLRNAFFSHKHETGIGLDEGEWVIIRNNVIEEMYGEPHILLREKFGLFR